MSGDIVPLWDGSATLQYRTFPEALATVPNMSQTIPVPEKPRTLWSVIAAVFFFPTGLAAVFQSGKTYASNLAGDHASAHDAASAARKWQNISAICFIALFILNLVFGGIWNN